EGNRRGRPDLRRAAPEDGTEHDTSVLASRGFCPGNRTRTVRAGSLEEPRRKRRTRGGRRRWEDSLAFARGVLHDRHEHWHGTDPGIERHQIERPPRQMKWHLIVPWAGPRGVHTLGPIRRSITLYLDTGSQWEAAVRRHGTAIRIERVDRAVGRS